MVNKTITNRFRKREKAGAKNVRRKLFKTNRNKYNQSKANYNTRKL